MPSRRSRTVMYGADVQAQSASVSTPSKTTRGQSMRQYVNAHFLSAKLATEPASACWEPDRLAG
jgi:hypothetical protein